MRLELPRKIGQPVHEQTNRRYRFVPLLAGLAGNTIDTSEVETRPIHEMMEAIRCGRMPNRGGFTEHGGELAAIDAVAAEIQPGLVRLLPELKRVVDSEGRVTEDSLVVYQTAAGLARIMAVTMEPADLRAPLGAAGSPARAHGRAMIPLDRLALGDLEFHDLAAGGAVELKPRRRYL